MKKKTARKKPAPVAVAPAVAPADNRMNLDQGGPTGEQVRAIRGDGVNLAAFTVPPAAALTEFQKQFQPKEVELLQFMGEPYYAAYARADLSNRAHQDTARYVEAGATLARVLVSADGDTPRVKENGFTQEELTTASRFGPALDKPLDDLVGSMPAELLSEALIGGVLKRDVQLDEASSLLMAYLDPDDFLLTPLPNHLFQRDNTAWVYDGMTINPMSKPARKRETINSRLVFGFHPMFRDADPPIHFYYGNDNLTHDPPTARVATSWSSATVRS